MTVPSRARMPAAVAAGAIASGILLAQTRAAASASVPQICCVAVALAILPIVNLVHGRAGLRGSAAVSDVVLIAALAASGTALCLARHSLVDPTDVSRLAPAREVTLEVRLSEARTRSDGRARALGRVPDGGCTSGSVWISWPPGAPPPVRGQLVRVTGELRRPAAPRNPGAFDFRGYLADRCVHAVVSGESTVVLEEPSGMASAAARVSDSVRTRLTGERGDVLRALLLGDTSGMPEELLGSFRRSGTVHVLAVSGLHVGFIALMAHALLRSLRVPRRAARLLVLACLGAFVMLVGARPSVVRASIMATSVILAWSLERRAHPVNAIGVASLALLLARPGSLFDVGFGLSFGATLGIVLLFPAVRTTVKWLDRFGRAGRLVADSLALSVSAQLGVAPVAVAAFGELSLVAPLANLAAVPLAAFSVASGVAMLATSLLPHVSNIFGAACWASLGCLAGLSRAAGGSAWSTILVGARFWPAAALVACAVGLSRTRGRAWKSCPAALALAGLVVAAMLFAGPGRSRPRLTVMDVGQGDAVVLELPRSRYVLVDAGTAWGGSSGPDAGRNVVLPYLRKCGVRRLEALIVTHGHNDHFGGVASVLAECPPRVLVLPAGYERSKGLGNAARIARESGVPVRSVEAGDTLVAARGCTLTVLSPMRALLSGRTGENDMSIVVRARLRGATLLLTGDAEERAEAGLLSRPRSLRAEIVKVAHHGSSSSSTAPFLDACRPSIAAISVGNGNRYGHPDSAAVRRLRSCGAGVLRTDRDGAIVIDVVNGTIRARGVLSGRRCRANCR